MSKISQLIQKQSYVYLTKNHDYGNSFAESLVKHGDVAYIVRAEDKIRRITTLIKHEAQVKDESITDTIIDLLNYTTMFKSFVAETGDVDFYSFVVNLRAFLEQPQQYMDYVTSLLGEVVTPTVYDYIVAYLINLVDEEGMSDNK